MDELLFKDTKVDNSSSVDHTPPRKKRKADEGLASIKTKHKEKKDSRTNKLRELYSAAKSLSDLDDSFSEPTLHQPDCHSPLYAELTENSQDRVSNDIEGTDSETSGSSIQLGSSSDSTSWSHSSGSSSGIGSDDRRNYRKLDFWKAVASASATKKKTKGDTVLDFFDSKKDYLPLEEEKPDWGDDTYLKQIVCCCFFKFK